MIIGPCGACKSTFAAALGKKLHRKVIHLDAPYWQPDWVKTSKEEWSNLQTKLVKEKDWIIDGNYKSTLDLRLTAADTIIFLDFPKWLCLWRSIKRRVQYHNKTRHDLGGESQERITWELIKWILTYPIV